MLNELASAGHETVALIQNPAPDIADSVVCDIMDPRALADAVKSANPDACVHLAGIAFVPRGWTDPNLVQSVNVIGTVNLLEVLRTHAPKARLVFASTSQIYGNPAQAAPLTEDTPLQPQNPYAVSKMAADLTVLLYARRYQATFMSARPANHIGPQQSTDFVVPAFAAQLAAIAAGKCDPCMKVGNLDSEREFTDVRDVCLAYRLVLEKGTPGRAYNIAAGRCVKIRTILDELCKLTGVVPKLDTDPSLYRPTDVQARLDATRLRTEIGWQPRFTLEQTLKDVLAGFWTAAA
jgi:GDP-4-dehydro-6-deoxy-D-mannose reductase